jgi:hypothetical protein
MLRWRKARRERRDAIEAAAEAWMARQGWYAYSSAGERAIDAYLLGDFVELKRWSEIRAVIRERVAPDASIEDLDRLLQPPP